MLAHIVKNAELSSGSLSKRQVYEMVLNKMHAFKEQMQIVSVSRNANEGQTKVCKTHSLNCICKSVYVPSIISFTQAKTHCNVKVREEREFIFNRLRCACINLVLTIKRCEMEESIKQSSKFPSVFFWLQQKNSTQIRDVYSF